MKKILIGTPLCVVLCLLLLSGFHTVSSASDSAAQTDPSDEATAFSSLIVKYRKDRAVTRATVASRLSRFGEVRFRKWHQAEDFSIVHFDKSKHDWKQLRSRIAADTDIEYVEPNYIMRVFAAPNDPYYQYQWNMQQLRMTEAWDITMGRTEVVVALIDSGVAYDLDDLAGTHFDLQNDKDFVANDNDAYDENSHGTHCAGTIAQTTNNNIGTVGMAPGVTILPLRVMAANGLGEVSDISDAIIYAADRGAHIISLSLGGGDFTNTMNDALRYAYQKGVTIFAASGNDGSGSVSYPAAYDNYVIAVGATGPDRVKTSYSQYGSSLDIVAPGGDMSVDRNGDGYDDGILQQTIAGYSWFRTDYTPVYAFYEGTSMACPHAAALGALLKSHNLSATPDQIRAAIQSSADDVGSSGWDSQHGHGLINPVAALKAIGGGTDPVETCQQWTATNDQHVTAGRAYTQQSGGCDDTTTYYAVGSNRELGTSGSTTTTLYSVDGSTFDIGTCPDNDTDADQDGFDAGEDCDDQNASVYPGAAEICADGIDQDCDGSDAPCEPDPCQQWTAANDQHVNAGRAYVTDSGGCDDSLSYYTIGANEFMGNDGSSATTLYSADGGQTYRLGQCP